jgi:hypothetical protein
VQRRTRSHISPTFSPQYLLSLTPLLKIRGYFRASDLLL